MQKNLFSSQDTLNRVMGLLCPDILQQLYGKWQEPLDKIQVKSQIVTIDAIGTQKAIAEKICRKRADDVLVMEGNQYIIRKWSLSILEMIELMKPGLSMKKKRFVISLRPIKYLEEVLSLKKGARQAEEDGNIHAFVKA